MKADCVPIRAPTLSILPTIWRRTSQNWRILPLTYSIVTICRRKTRSRYAAAKTSATITPLCRPLKCRENRVINSGWRVFVNSEASADEVHSTRKSSSLNDYELYIKEGSTSTMRAASVPPLRLSKKCAVILTRISRS